MLLIAAIWSHGYIKRNPERFTWPQLDQKWFWVPMLSVIIMGSSVMLMLLFGRFFNFLWLIRDEPWSIPSMAVVAFVAGGFFFMLRECERPLYGLFELYIAIASTATYSTKLFAHPPPDSTGMLQLVTSVYIVVRGLDNLLLRISFGPKIEENERYAEHPILNGFPEHRRAPQTVHTNSSTTDALWRSDEGLMKATVQTHRW
jgi:hypothetical protein